MKDGKGLYYYPYPANKQLRMYVRDNDGIVEFRLDHPDDPSLWEEHGWITYEAAKKASQMFKGRGPQDPMALYDFEVALSVLRDEERSRKHSS